ncbi:hypothetical protein [Kineobactrum salinum]|uniref:Uncharacterized protein n=1 Tax=Kineobactrum salinum TaxID=2708301 RepID=A0A6C0TYF3_9GAMM|nr:hypothetical protein [Kineobactrum salinum]QIB64563.1 hypothetical protein G3T16_03245 [Kineobactrum salinum]
MAELLTRPFTTVNSLYRSEIALTESCSEEIRRLTGSDEAIEKLNVIIDDITQAMRKLNVPSGT